MTFQFHDTTQSESCLKFVGNITREPTWVGVNSIETEMAVNVNNFFSEFVLEYVILNSTFSIRDLKSLFVHNFISLNNVSLTNNPNL